MGKGKPYRGISIEGLLARWYARSTGKLHPQFRAEAEKLAKQLRPESLVLEIAPGPGYLAIELARLGPFRITGLDISRSFVRMAAENAARAGVSVDFRHGNAAAMPFAAEWFDLIICRAAFKNFSDPAGAIREMHRVLRPSGRAMIIDLNRNATNQAIADEVAKMALGPVDAFLTRLGLRWLRKRAYTREDFMRMAAESPFGRCDIAEGGIGFEVTMMK